MKLFKKDFTKDELLYGGFIITFAILYGATAFVSWYHAITFFNIANAAWLSVILSFVAEIGQASALFSLLLTENKKEWLTWFVMVILTLLQVIGNVDSSYAWIVSHGDGVDAFRKSILFWIQSENTDTFKIVIAWITGALLPIIALSMTALVAQNIELRTKKIKTALDDDSVPETKPPEPIIDAKDIISEVSKVRPTIEDLEILEAILKEKKSIEKVPPEDETPTDQVTEPPKKEFRFVSPGVSIYEGVEEHSPSLQGLIREYGSLEKVIEKLKEWDKMEKEDEVSEKEEIPPENPVLTQEEIENVILPHYSDEEVFDMNLDEHEKKWDDMDQEVADLTPGSIEPIPKPEIKLVHENGLVEGIMESGTPAPEYKAEPLPELSPDEFQRREKVKQEELKQAEEVAKRLENERLEKIRRLAKEQDELKKK